MKNIELLIKAISLALVLVIPKSSHDRNDNIIDNMLNKLLETAKQTFHITLYETFSCFSV